MDSIQPLASKQLLGTLRSLDGNYRPATARWIAVTCCAGLMMALTSPVVFAQAVRTKRPDRDSYQSPVLQPVQLEDLATSQTPGRTTRRASSPNRNRVRQASHHEIELTQAEQLPAPIIGSAINPTSPSPTDPAANPAPVLAPPVLQQPTFSPSTSYHANEPEIVIPRRGHHVSDHSDGIEVFSLDGSCDDLGCDAIGGSGWSNSRLRFSPEQWFGRLELLLLFRSGDRPPSLVTTGPDEANADAEVLVGGELLLQDITAGGRLTLGTWLDDYHHRSLVFRGWTATEADFTFSQDQTDNAVLGRPFFNVTDGEVAADDVNLIASPGVADGSITVEATSNVFGADISIRQPWVKGLGATVDLLYGYQYVGLTEDLSISSSVVSLSDALAPVGAQIDILDEFDTDNDFHGGQIGVAGRYREGCWSFDGLIKIGFGGLRRAATRRGTTVTTIDGVSATDPNGLLVRGTNDGVTSDSTFAWVPEVDLSIGYRRFKNTEITFGYNLVVLTDALQVSGSIDPALASNLADPPLGSQNPSPDLRFSTFYVQGIHFGIQTIF